MSPISFTPRSAAWARSAVHSRSKRTWSSSASSPAKASQSSIQSAARSRKSIRSAALTGAFGEPSNFADAANADADLYGESCSSGGPSGSICHQVCPAEASQSTHA